MTRSLKTVSDLIAHGLATDDQKLLLEDVAARYAIALTPILQDLIDPQDPTDPIALQFIPQPAELETTAEEMTDPIGDKAHMPVKGIVHRYPDRVLLKAVHICPVYCRFCFRREMVGPSGDGSLTETELDEALYYIAHHKNIWEVILTGGDPLILSNRRLNIIMAALAKMDHVRVVRLHTRVPIAMPERIDEALITSLKQSNKTVYLAIHANHPRELTPAMRSACAILLASGIMLLSQTVLLRGVNDNAETLAQLMRGFVELGIRPYYLHHPDFAPGTAHFRVSITEGRRIVEQLRGRISGLCQPTYILDIPGGFGKSPIGANYVNDDDKENVQILDYQGNWHVYPKDQL